MSRLPVTTILLTLLVVAGCQTVSGPPGDGELTPLGEYQRVRLAAAMAGLLYEGDRVRTDPEWPVGAGGEAAALERLDAGRGLLDQGRRVEALRAFTDAVLAAPELAEPYLWLGRALVAKHRYDEALAAYRTALDVDAALVEARYRAGCVLQALARLDEALGEWHEVVRRDPGHGESHARLAAGHYLAGDSALALEHLAHASRLGAATPTHLAGLIQGSVPRAPAADGQDLLIGEQLRIDVGGGASASNETTAAAGGTTPAEVLGGWNDYREPDVIRAGFGLSLDGGATWSEHLVRPPAGHQADVEGDPMTAYDPRTRTLWAGAIAFGASGGVYVARKQPGADSFEPAVTTLVDGSADKCWLAAGPVPGDPDSTRLYVAYNLGLQYSDDLGDTWSGLRALDPSGLGYLPRVGPNGELYVAYWDLGYQVRIQRSLDGGLSFSAPLTIATRVDTWNDDNFPGDFRVPPLTSLAVDLSDGTLYAVWFDVTGVIGGDANVDLLISRSEDQGDTWTPPVVIAGQGLPFGDQFFPWIEVDHAGRLHLLFYDTRHTPQHDTDPSAFIDAYYALSDDHGATWSEHRLTPAPFDSAFATGATGQFIGDYNGLAVAGDQAWPVYMSTQNGDRDIFTHTITVLDGAFFSDGFESGDTGAWGRP